MLMHFSQMHFWCFQFGSWDVTEWGEVLLWYLRSDRWWIFVTSSPVILLPSCWGFLFAITSSCSGTVGLLIVFRWEPCVIRWPGDYHFLDCFLLLSKCDRIFRLWRIAKLSPSLPFSVGWAEYGRIWLKWSLCYLVVINARWFFRCCSFTYRWPYDRFLSFTISLVQIAKHSFAKLGSSCPSWVRF